MAVKSDDALELPRFRRRVEMAERLIFYLIAFGVELDDMAVVSAD